MRTQVNLSLSSDTATALRSLADEVGAPIGELADLLLRMGHTRTSPDKLRSWALALPSRLGRNAGGPTLVERKALAALEALREGDHAGTVFGVGQVADRSGLPVREAYRAIRALEARGLVGVVGSDEVDRWGRPSELVTWTRAGALEVDQRLALESIRGLRRDMALTSFDPVARGLIRRRVLITAGWGEGASALPDGLEVAAGEAPAIGPEQWEAWFASRWFR